MYTVPKGSAEGPLDLRTVSLSLLDLSTAADYTYGQCIPQFIYYLNLIKKHFVKELELVDLGAKGSVGQAYNPTDKTINNDDSISEIYDGILFTYI